MAYSPENNPYIPGDPYSYDLKWMVKKINEWKDPLDSAERAKASEEAAAASAGEAADSATAAAGSASSAQGSAQTAANYANNIGDPVSGIVVDWLADNITQPTTPAIDASLTIAGAAADAGAAGEQIKIAADSRKSIGNDLGVTFQVISGSYIKTDGTIVTNASYFYSKPICLLPGQIADVVSDGDRTDLCYVAKVDRNGNFQTMLHRTSTSPSYEARYMNESSEVEYIAISGKDPSLCSCTILTPDYDIMDVKKLTYFINNSNVITRVNEIVSTGLTNNYVCTEPFYLKAGERIALYGLVSANIPAIIKTDKQGSALSFPVTGTGSLTWYDFIADTDGYYKAQYRDVNDFVLSKQASYNNSFPMDLRKGVVSFIFDDGVPEDETIHDIFISKGLRCGFALMSSIFNNPRSLDYLKWQSEGFDILSHSINADPMSDPTIDPGTINTYMLQSLSYLSARGFDIKGWVTPSSTLASVFNNIPKKHYSYAYTIYYGTYTGQATPPYNDLSERYDLYRVDLNSSLANMEAAVDLAIANKGFLTFYYHAASLDSIHEQRIKDIMDYVNTKIASNDLRCLPPNEAFEYYYTPRVGD